MNLITSSSNILNQLVGLIKQLSPEEYTSPLPLLMDNSISKHLRHIVEFYDCLFKGIADASINYDLRERNPSIENDPEFAINFINNCIQHLSTMELSNDPINLTTLLSPEGHEACTLTSLDRELAYNVEHAIHHMAIIKIAIKQCYPHVTLSKDFGVAYSTIKFHHQTA
ncbi:DinB family protein [Microscilla marina]|uniref:DinB-like domain-containing protein n=1 Tax=Microscilla marina ATCC 23134 TaxID=313606 RepID=A1ZLB5_MICM2|nr:DinB family protein [Microscilla marina]EAY28669.1 conserved hypothetical protein [Microscilla marina ATCC 23134]